MRRKSGRFINLINNIPLCLFIKVRKFHCGTQFDIFQINKFQQFRD